MNEKRSDMTLYAANTANGQKATVVLEELRLQYDVVKLDLIAGEHQSEDYKALNPIGRIPTLLDQRHEDVISVYGTLAIGLYLSYGTDLLPDAPVARAQVNEVAALVSTDLAPALSGQFMFSMILPDKPESAIDYFINESHRYLSQLERWAESRVYLAGDAYTVADAIAYPNIAVSAERIDPELATYPSLQRWRDLVAQRPAIQRGMAALA